MANFLDKHFGRMGNRMFQMAYLYAQARDGKIQDFYLQDNKHFDKYKDELRNLFKQEGPTLDYISVHVRRGLNPSNPEEPAYSENPFYVNLSNTDYYQKAMAEFPNEQFLFFSDDVEWVKKNFDPDQFSVGTELEDFSAMARCKGHIIANSSFSWWAAYIGGGKTVAPKEWFSDGVKRVGFPEDWIVV